MQDRSDGGIVPSFTLAVPDAMVVEEVCQPEFSISGGDTEVEHHSDDFGFRIIYDQLVDLMLPLVQDAALFQAVAVGSLSTPEASFFNHLPQRGLGTDRGFLTFAISLPESDVVSQAIRVGFKPLFTFLDTPNPDALADKPLYHEGRFI